MIFETYLHVQNNAKIVRLPDSTEFGYQTLLSEASSPKRVNMIVNLSRRKEFAKQWANVTDRGDAPYIFGGFGPISNTNSLDTKRYVNPFRCLLEILKRNRQNDRQTDRQSYMLQ